MKHGLLVAIIALFSRSSFALEECGTVDPAPQLATGIRLIADTTDAQVANLWSEEQSQNLTFCIDDRFKKDKPTMVSAFLDAVEAWEEHANVNFVYLSEHDSKCSKKNKNVLFRVNVLNSRRMPFVARAFFPGTEQKKRYVIFKRKLVQGSYIELLRVAKHELGHVLGFRHEHISPDNPNRCKEDENFTALTDYDRQSIMHYSRCGGSGNSSLSELDKLGASLAYPFS
jgi:hypothetical protein